MSGYDATNPRTWGNCIRREDLPPILTEACEWNAGRPCPRPAMTWRFLSHGWFPLCRDHAEHADILDREWDEAEDEMFGR